MWQLYYTYSDISLVHTLFYARFLLMRDFLAVLASDIIKPLITLIHLCATLKAPLTYKKFQEFYPFCSATGNAFIRLSTIVHIPETHSSTLYTWVYALLSFLWFSTSASFFCCPLHPRISKRSLYYKMANKICSHNISLF